VPTIGRPQSLSQLLVSLAAQTVPVREVLVADSSSQDETERVTNDPRWAENGLVVKRILVHPPHAVRQREAAIAAAKGKLLLLLDDDVELEPLCVEEMVKALATHPNVVAVMADFNNQEWPMPTQAWRLYLRFVHGIKEGEWQGRVIGPLLRYGYNPTPKDVSPIEWLGTCNSLICRNAFERAGGFSSFFLHRSTMNEDVDLGIRLSRVGIILFAPKARLSHIQDSRGRVSPYQAAEDDLYNRFLVLHRTVGHARLLALGLAAVFVLLESASNLLGAVLNGRWGMTGALLRGRMSALIRILRCWGRLDNSSAVVNRLYPQ
jgi:GT2 family glycosyltransferase